MEAKSVPGLSGLVGDEAIVIPGERRKGILQFGRISIGLVDWLSMLGGLAAQGLKLRNSWARPLYLIQ